MRGATLVAENITKEYGSTLVLDGLSLTVPPGARIGVVGPNGSGKSTLLRVLAGIDEPSSGTVTRAGSVGYLPQEPERRQGETLLNFFARRTGVAADLERRARKVCLQLEVGVPLDAELPMLSGGEAARIALAALLLARFDVLCLDEPTNDLDFPGLDRLEQFVDSFRGSIVVVSHDREFLDRTVTRIVAFDAETRRVREFAGTYADFERQRDAAHEREVSEYERYVEERDRFSSLLSARRTEARAGAGLGEKSGGADRRGTNALRGKVRQAEKRLDRLEEVDKPWRPWRLQLKLEPRARSGDVVARLRGAVVERGTFRLGPVDLAVGWGDRVAIAGRNGAGKTTLLRALTGDLPLARGTRTLGRGVVVGELDQRRAL